MPLTRRSFLYHSTLAAAGLLTSRTHAADAPRIDGIGPVGDVVKVHDGCVFTEGPAWDGKGSLYFSDIPANKIYKVDPEGKVTVFLDDSAGCNGLAFDAAGTLYACQGGKGKLIAIDVATKKITELAELTNGKKQGAPNDLALDRSGGIYFTDPDEVPGVYYRAADGKVTKTAVKVRRPNGVVLSPDEKTLYSIPSGQSEMMAYPVKEPGVLGEGKVFCTVTQPKDQKNSGGDGGKVDAKGNLYIATRAGVQVFAPDGKQLGILPQAGSYPNHPANLAFGGPKLQTLYVCSRKAVYKMEMMVPGAVFPGRKQ